MTKGRAGLPGTVVVETGVAQEVTAETQISPLRSPGFPVETRGFEHMHAALSTESRTRGRR